MLIASLLFAVVAVLITLKSRATAIRCRIEAGTFAGLDAEIEEVLACEAVMERPRLAA